MGIVLRRDLVNRVVEVKRISDRLMTMKLEIDGMLINIVHTHHRWGLMKRRRQHSGLTWKKL